MIQSLSHIQRSRRLSQDFDDYLERTSRSSLHSSSSDIQSPQYAHVHQHEAKLQAYQQLQNNMRQLPIAYQHDFQNLMHNARSGPNEKHEPPNALHMQPIEPPPPNAIIAQNKLIGHLNGNGMKQFQFSGVCYAEPNDLSDGNTSFMDDMSSDSDLGDDEIQYNRKRNKKEHHNSKHNKVLKLQYPQLIHQLPKVPKPRNLNINTHRIKYLRHPSVTSDDNDPINMRDIQINLSTRHERADSNGSAMSSSIVSSVCTPHQEDHEGDEKAHSFFGKHQIPDQNITRSMCGGSGISNVSKMSNLLSSTIQSDISAQSIQSVQSMQSVQASIHIQIKIFDTTHCTIDYWMNIRPTDIVDDVICTVIHQYRQTNQPLIGTKVEHYELRYYDEDEDEIDEDLPPLGRHECVAAKQIDAVAMVYVGGTNNSNEDNPDHHIPDVDWDYTEYQVKDEYSKTKTKCILGIGRDRIHIVIKSNKRAPSPTDYSDLMRRRISSNGGSMSGSLMPHFTYVFRLPNGASSKKKLYQHRWIDARVLTRQKNCRINLHQDTYDEKQNGGPKPPDRERQNAVYTGTQTSIQTQRQRAVATTFQGATLGQLGGIPKLGLQLQSSIPTNNLLQNMQELRLKPLRSGLCLEGFEDEDKNKQRKGKQTKKNRRASSAWSFNLNIFGLLNKSKDKEKDKGKDGLNGVPQLQGIASHKYSTSTVATDDSLLPNYESWNTYNKDGRYVDPQDKASPKLRGHYRSGSGSVASFLSSRNRRSSVASIISIENDEFTPLTIELCQKISVLKRDNKVFEINFLLDLSSQTRTPSASTCGRHPLTHSHSNSFINHNRTPSKTYWGPRSMRKKSLAAADHEFSQQSSTRSLSIQSGNQSNDHCDKKTQFQPYQADSVEIWTDVSQSHSHSQPDSLSPSRSSTMELIDVGDYKPTNYWNPTQIIPKLEQISAAQHNDSNYNYTCNASASANANSNSNSNLNANTNKSHPNSLVKQLVNKAKFHVFGNDKYLTHTVRYCAKSPEDCCQIVRKIQHLMLLENKAMEN
eukprot:534315_1